VHHLAALLALRHLLGSRVRGGGIALRDRGDRRHRDGAAKLGGKEIETIERELRLARRDLVPRHIAEGGTPRRLVERRDIV
jgi:hypothetical protein